MKIILYFGINLMSFLFGMICAFVIVYASMKKNPKKPSKERRILMCQKTKEAGNCPQCCEICAWGRSVYEN